MTSTDTDFDPAAKEQQLRSESEQWDTSRPEDARPDDIPTIDLEPYFTRGSDQELSAVAEQLRIACEETGFFSIVGHQIAREDLDDTFEQVRQFHAMPIERKNRILMDRPDWPVGGMGYLPLKNRKLPARETGNVNEAFIIKCDDTLGMDDNQWPDADWLPGFRARVEHYAHQMESLGKRLLPVYARALDMPADFFNKAFVNPLYRLRMTHYPAIAHDPENAFGIAPHVDTSFCTILAQDRPGLSVFSERRKVWVNAPVVKDSFIVNTGELLKQWTNDRFLSTRHFANNNTGAESRYSIPFFFNANPHHVMTCIPSCCSEENPARYPPISYAQSQGVVQGE
ncbi:isopenicillin N synthase family dioxygenase [Granulosicoccus sp. 3-233]|uniref:isopenicillin N synthase family dioxygenase n=1 Tax=Granulosicoccus sp. 3-233 TaxID=3417969 RepID=UPI003D34D9D6